jgi:hypothetical protein
MLLAMLLASLLAASHFDFALSLIFLIHSFISLFFFFSGFHISSDGSTVSSSSTISSIDPVSIIHFRRIKLSSCTYRFGSIFCHMFFTI